MVIGIGIITGGSIALPVKHQYVKLLEATRPVGRKFMCWSHTKPNRSQEVPEASRPK